MTLDELSPQQVVPKQVCVVTVPHAPLYSVEWWMGRCLVILALQRPSAFTLRWPSANSWRTSGD